MLLVFLLHLHFVKLDWLSTGIEKRSYRSWGIRAFINAFGCVATFIVLIIIVESKFFEGVWIVIIAIAIIMYGLYAIKTHYIRREHNLSTKC